MIVATISSPKTYSPLLNLNNAVKKTGRILTSLVDAGFINNKRAEYQYNEFLNKWDVKFDDAGNAVSSLIGSFLHSSYRINRAPFFSEQIRRVLIEKFGEETVKKGGLKVYTTIDAVKQDAALGSLQKGIQLQRDFHLKMAEAARNPEKAEMEKEKAANIEGALISINPYSGEILSYVGGSEFSATNQNDNVSQIKRQPGSSFKPVIYEAAVEKGTVTPSTVIVDEATEFPGGYRPKNYDEKHVGPVIVREALTKSINVVSVKILERTGYDKIFSIIGSELSLGWQPNCRAASEKLFPWPSAHTRFLRRKIALSMLFW